MIVHMTVTLPSLNALQMFEAAARHLSFTQAANELNVTQTAVSHQIRRLEEQLGVRLFVRLHRKLTLTREATDYLPAIRTAFEDMRLATDRLRRFRPHDVLTVSTTVSLAAKWLVPRLAGFQAANPGVEVRISTSMRLVDFRHEEIDVAIRFGLGDWPGLSSAWLMAEDIFPVCSPALLAGPKPLGRPADLAEHTLLHVDTRRDEWQLWLTAAGLDGSLAARPSLSFDQRLMALQAATDGLGVALGYQRIVEADIAAGRLVAPFDRAHAVDHQAGYYIVAPSETADVPKIARFRDWLMRSVSSTGANRPS
jgi:LysR family glycine cleavage system transcriptional activator